MTHIRLPKFTLRMLVGLGALLLLGFLFIPASNKLMDHPVEVRMMSYLKEISIALGHFITEYNKLPVKADETQVLRSDGPLMLSLLGVVSDVNPRGIKFIDLPLARNGMSFGLTNLSIENTPAPDTALVDLWGEKFFIILESTEDGLIPNPEYQGGANATLWHKPPPMIRARALIYSAGADRDPNTWEDNVRSWQRDGQSP